MTHQRVPQPCTDRLNIHHLLPNHCQPFKLQQHQEGQPGAGGTKGGWGLGAGSPTYCSLAAATYLHNSYNNNNISGNTRDIGSRSATCSPPSPAAHSDDGVAVCRCCSLHAARLSQSSCCAHHNKICDHLVNVFGILCHNRLGFIIHGATKDWPQNRLVKNNGDQGPCTTIFGHSNHLCNNKNKNNMDQNSHSIKHQVAVSSM